jgi:pilus assembly protein CpaC
MEQRPVIKAGFIAAAVGLVLCVWALAIPADAASSTPEHAHLSVEVGKTADITLAIPVSSVFVVDQEIADVHPENAKSIIIYGKKVGTTTVNVLSNGHVAAVYDVDVQRSVGAVSNAIRSQLSGGDVSVAGTPQGLIVSGHVPSPQDAQAVASTAQQYQGDKDKLTLNLGVDQSTQVNLQVRVVEVSRSAEHTFGFNWQAIFNNGSTALGLLTGRTPLNGITNTVTGATTPQFGDFARNNQVDSIGFGYLSPGGSLNVSAMIDALQSEGLISVLAQPNLTATSGSTANFLAGGEFPVPVAQALNQITIDWKRFGVGVDFTPTVLNANRMSITVRSEVSELSDKGAVVINSIKVPSIAVRRAQTTVELGSGQSFAIAGLYQNNSANQVDKFPGLGSLPILGALFRSSSFQHNESELVIIVTPYIVKPISKTSDLHVPGEGMSYSSDLDRILSGRLKGGSPAPDPLPHLRGDAGFMMEK